MPAAQRLKPGRGGLVVCGFRLDEPKLSSAHYYVYHGCNQRNRAGTRRPQIHGATLLLTLPRHP